MPPVSDAAYYEKRIRRVTGWFFFGCLLFILFELGAIYAGCTLFVHPERDWPSAFAAIGLGGIWLLWEMTMAATFKTPLPPHFRPAGSEGHIHGIIQEITAALGLPAPEDVYFTDGMDAAVFCRPNLLSLLRKPKYELVLGTTLLECLTDDELKVVLYHEFGHYASRSLHKKTPAYVVAQFSKSFTTVKETDKPGVWRNMVKSQIALFSYFAFLMCDKIDRHFRHISRNEEFMADDVAAAHMGADLLCVTLAKVAMLDHYYRYVSWTRQQFPDLPVPTCRMAGLLLALCRTTANPRPLLSRQILQRIERHNVSSVALPAPHAQAAYTGHSLLRALRAFYPRYAAELRRRRSVRLRFFLPRRPHRLPLVEGKYRILLDGRPVGNGNFIKGYTFDVLTAPGRHRVEAYNVSGILTVPFDIECREGDSFLVKMDYKVHLRNGYYTVFANSAIPIIHQ